MSQAQSQLANRLAKVRKNAEELEVLTNEEGKLKQQLAVLEGITKRRQSPLGILKEIDNLIPKEAWVKNIKINSGRLEITGTAMALNNVNRFFQALNQSYFFENVVLKSSGKEDRFQAFILELGIKRYE